MDSIHFDETQVLIIDEKLNHDEVLKKMACLLYTSRCV